MSIEETQPPQPPPGRDLDDDKDPAPEESKWSHAAFGFFSFFAALGTAIIFATQTQDERVPFILAGAGLLALGIFCHLVLGWRRFWRGIGLAILISLGLTVLAAGTCFAYFAIFW